MIQRETAYDGEPQIQLHDREIGRIIDQLNGGLDPNTLPQGKLTIDKFRITNPGTGAAAYSMTQTPVAQIPAGGVATLSIGFNSPVANVGLSVGQYFPASIYADFFIDPTGSGGASIANIYSNTPGTGTAKVMTSAVLANSVNTSSQPNQIFVVNVQAHNFDSVAHWVYVSVNVCVINTQNSTATT